MAEPILYAEPGSSWWPLAWGPGLALVGVVLDLTAGSSVQALLWIPVAVVFTLVSAVWVATRRKVRSMSLTTTTLRQGREELAVSEIVDVGEAGAAMGAPVLGGGWLVPNGTDGVPLRLTDGRSVLGWARDSETFTAALRRLLGIEVPETPAALDALPPVGSPAAPGDAPGDVLFGDASDGVPSNAPEDVPSGDASDGVPGGASEGLRSDVSQGVPDGVSGDVPDDASDPAPGGTGTGVRDADR